MNTKVIEAEVVLAGMPSGYEWFVRMYTLNCQPVRRSLRKCHLFRYPVIDGKHLSACEMVSQKNTYQLGHFRKGWVNDGKGNFIAKVSPPYCKKCLRKLLWVINNNVSPERFTLEQEGRWPLLYELNPRTKW